MKVSIVVDIQTISIAVASASVVAGVIYYALQIRHQNKMRQTDLVMRLHLHVVNKEFMDAYQRIKSLEFKDYNDFVEKFGPVNAERPEQTAIMMLAMFMEGIGVLLHQKLADAKAIGELFPVEASWEKLEPILIENRKQSGDPETWKWFEYLYNEVKNRKQRR
jgi:hypothetical protein